MANPEHLSKIREGADVEAWNQWRENNVEVKLDLSGADLNGVNLHNVNLSLAYLIGTDFNLAHLSGADLSLTYLIGANLIGADLTGANFVGAYLRNAYLIGADCRNTYCTGANLRGADLTGADFTGADLTGADLTGAIIEDWHIGPSTRLDDIQCDYVFRQRDPETGKPTARLPIAPSSTFASGEFIQHFPVLERGLETIDLTFIEGIDWKAFGALFQQLRQQYPHEVISIQAMERKGEALVVRLGVSHGIDKGAIEMQAKQLYETQLKALEVQYEKQLRLQGLCLADRRQVLESERRETASLIRVVETMANNQQGPKYDMQAAKVSDSLTETFQGDRVGGAQHNYAAPAKRDLADAALEIQSRLKQLEEINPTATESEQKAFVTAAIPPTLRQRAVGALQAGGTAAVEELLDHLYVTVAIAVIEGWQGAE